MIAAVILAGGPGTGLWPYSRALHPKPVLPLLGEVPLLARALEIARRFADEVIVVAHDDHRFLVAEICKDQATLLLEPSRCNTALPVAAVAAGLAPEHVMVVLPADLILAGRAWVRAIEALAAQADARDAIGVLTTRAQSATERVGWVDGSRFVAEPDPATAHALFERGARWHSGITVARVSALQAAFERDAPEIAACGAMASQGTERDLQFMRLDARAYDGAPEISFERAVLEPAADLVAVAEDGKWADIGTWKALWSTHTADPDGNTIRGDATATGSKRSYIDARHRLVVAVGLDDIVIVETADAVLVAHKGAVERVAEAVTGLGDREETRTHRRVARPWGSFERIDQGPRFQVKRIFVEPGHSLSLQRHQQRAEHWVVVRGVAHVIRGEETLQLREDQSTYIPAGMAHRLENRGSEPLEIVEVQTGDYLGEDDIERLDDRYGR